METDFRTAGTVFNIDTEYGTGGTMINAGCLHDIATVTVVAFDPLIELPMKPVDFFLLFIHPVVLILEFVL